MFFIALFLVVWLRSSSGSAFRVDSVCTNFRVEGGCKGRFNSAVLAFLSETGSALRLRFHLNAGLQFSGTISVPIASFAAGKAPETCPASGSLISYICIFPAA